MLCNKLLPHTIDISKEIISNIKSAYQRCKEQTRLNKDKSKETAKQLAQEVVLNEIKDTQAKQDQMRKLSEILHADLIKYVEKAEKKQHISLISKASAMQQKSDENNKEVKQLEEAHGFLKKKLKSIN